MVLGNKKKVDVAHKPYIVAELNSSHRGKIELAKEMIMAAKKCGCDAVKFQSWNSESLYCKEYYDSNPMSKRMADGFSLSSEALLSLSRFAYEIGIDFSSTPYSKEEADFLVDECAVPFIKIASMDINNFPFLRHIASRKVPIVLSTGMATIEEIKDAMSVIASEGCRDICILHCVSVYPVAHENVNLKNILMLKKEFPDYEIGYSDHTVGIEAACAAIGMGATLIEKHFTLDSSRIGWDNQMATEPEEMSQLVRCCQNVYKALGKYDRCVSNEEMEQRLKMRRSIVASVDIKKGSVITPENITALRPGEGISVSEYDHMIGRTLGVDVQKGKMLKVSDFQ